MGAGGGLAARPCPPPARCPRRSRRRRADDRLLRDLHRRHPGLRIGRSDAIVETLIPTILGQRVTSIEALRSYHALARWLGDAAPGPSDVVTSLGLRLRPCPERLATLAYHDLHRLGVERGRARTLIGVARLRSSIERWVARPVDEATRALRSLPGIGPWTAAYVAEQAFGDPDAVIVGDYHLPNIVAWNLAGEARGTDARMLELLEALRRPARAGGAVDRPGRTAAAGLRPEAPPARHRPPVMLRDARDHRPAVAPLRP